MKKRELFYSAIILTFILLTPFGIVKAQATGYCPFLEGGIVPCGRETDNPSTAICECTPCEVCHLMVLFDRIVEFATFNIAIPLGILMFVVGGIMLLIAGGDPRRISKGKTILKVAIIGFVIILTAWLVVNTIVFFAANGRIPLPGEIGTILGQPWNEVECPYCGDGICQDGTGGTPDRGENPVTCPLDCLAFIWVPLSGNDELVQMSLADGSIISTYTVGDNPSRLTVIPGGDVWVANRDSNDVTRLSPDMDNLPFYEVVGTYPVGSGPRAVTYDLNGDIWVGNYGDGTVMKLDPETGSIIDTIVVGGSPYGAIGDPYGNVWIANRGTASVNRIDISTGAVVSTVFPSNIYGIGMDNEGDIWMAGYNAPGGIWEVAGGGKSNTGTIINYFLGGIAGFRGIAVDGNNYVWTANSISNQVYIVDQNGIQVPGSPIATGYSGIIGVAIDRQNNSWVISRTSSRVLQYGAVDGPSPLVQLLDINVGGSPYNYSDMTGFRSMGCPRPR